MEFPKWFYACVSSPFSTSGWDRLSGSSRFRFFSRADRSVSAISRSRWDSLRRFFLSFGLSLGYVTILRIWYSLGHNTTWRRTIFITGIGYGLWHGQGVWRTEALGSGLDALLFLWREGARRIDRLWGSSDGGFSSRFTGLRPWHGSRTTLA